MPGTSGSPYLGTRVSAAQFLIKNVPLVGKDQVPWTFKVLLKKLTRAGVSCAGDVPGGDDDGGDGGDDGDGDGDTHGASASEK